jgi:DNA mismatch repair protein MutL
MRSPIRPLPTHLVNQIAAGEVVERPASVVKELVENALDAKASRIDVTIEGGGRDLIRVTDDGVGIPPEELPLALAPHATSKIVRAEDLEAILTMGFRGEALASIASVSRVRIVSRTRDADAAASIEAEGDRVGSPQPAAAPPGTSVSVQTLFFNVPARRKFLKSEAAEASRIVETLESIAMGHPRIRFTLTHGSKKVLDLASTEDPRRRASEVLDVERAALTGDKAALLEASGDEGPLTVWGLVGRPELARANAKHLRIHLNGRPVADRAILHAVREAYRGLIAPGLTPLAAIFLELHPREVDVNVHPAKTEVRFRQPSMIHQGVLRAVRRALRAGRPRTCVRARPSDGRAGAGSAARVEAVRR